MKISIVGCGGISRTHIGAVREIPDARIISVADCIPERAQAAAEQCGAKAYTSLEAMLSGEKPDILHICTPHCLHVPMAVYAMEHGIDVLCEKPCAMTEEQLKALRDCQHRTGRQFGVCFQNRYNRSVRYLKDIIDSGLYGELIGMRAFVTWKRDTDYYASGDWRGKKATEGGGVLINQALHTLDLMNMLGGGVKAVTAHCSNDHLRGIIEVEDTVSVFAEFSRGFRGVFFATTANAVTSPIILEANFADRSIRIEGDSVFEQKDGKLTPVLDADSFVNHGKACWGSGHAALPTEPLQNGFLSVILAQTVQPEKPRSTGRLDGGMLDVETVFDGISAFPENIQQRRKCEADCNGRVQILPDKIADGGLAAALGVPFCIVLTAALRLNDRESVLTADLIGNAANIFKVIFERIAIFHSIHE